MKKIRFVFFVAQFEWRNAFTKGKKIHLIDDIISWWTLPFNWGTPGYSHWSGWIPDENDKFYWTGETANIGLPDGTWGVVGTCYTSTMRGDDNGTVSRPAAGVFKHPERWHYIEFEVTDESFEEAKAWANERVDKNIGYGKKTILRFALPLWVVKKTGLDDPLRDICSEFGEGWAVILVVIRKLLGLETHTYMLSKIFIRSPRRLWRDLVRRHHLATYSLATGKMVYNEKGRKVK